MEQFRIAFFGVDPGRALFLPPPFPMATSLRIKIEREIGRGAHSRVKLGRDTDSFEPLAIKIIDMSESGRAVFWTEKTLLSKVQEHRCIPKLYGHYQTTTKGCLVLEYLPFPTLKELLAERALTEDQSIHILRQLVDTLHYMTSQSVSHRDLKCDNIIVNPDTLAIKLIDFGLGTEIDDEDSVDSSYRGTPVYMAPEVLRELPNYKIIPAELWSIGVIFLECLIGSQPFEGAKSKRDLLNKQGKFSDKVTSLSERSREIIKGLLAPNPTDRPSIASVRDQIEDLFEVRCNSRGAFERSYTNSRAKTFTDLRDFFAMSNGIAPAASLTPRCPLANPHSASTSPSRHR